MTKARDIADFKFENITDTGTEGTRIALGTTAQRGSTQGQIRFNSTTNLAEYYDGSAFKSIDSPPTITSISPTTIPDSSTSTTITINGNNFSTSPTIVAVGADNSTISPSSTNRISGSQITAVFNGTSFSDAQEDYGIKITNTSGLTFTLSSALAVNATPAFTIASGTLGSYPEQSAMSKTVTATDDEGQSLTFAVASGSLPSGLSLNTSTGVISGTPSAITSDTTSNFTLSVTDGTGTATRAYSLTITASNYFGDGSDGALDTTT